MAADLVNFDFLMRAAIAAAGSITRAAVRPNPRVGAALQTRDLRVFTGAHKVLGGVHAEVDAIEAARTSGADLAGATLAVTLEPCAHHGRRGPCVERILQEKIATVVVGARDPNQKVSGGGAEFLKAQGVNVIGSALERECVDSNFDWHLMHRRRRPKVVLKVAISADGFMKRADGKRWITDENSRAEVGILRSQVDAVLTTTQTVMDDDPYMTARKADGSLFSDQPQIVVWGDRLLDVDKLNLSKHPREVVMIPRSGIGEMLERLYLVHEYQSVLVEAGALVSQMFIDGHHYDELIVHQSAEVLGPIGRLPLFLNGSLP